MKAPGDLGRQAKVSGRLTLWLRQFGSEQQLAEAPITTASFAKTCTLYHAILQPHLQAQHAPTPLARRTLQATQAKCSGRSAVQTGCPWHAHGIISAHVTQVICPHAAAGRVLYRSYSSSVVHRVFKICGMKTCPKIEGSGSQGGADVVTSANRVGRSRYKANHGIHYPPMICALTIRYRMLDLLPPSRGCHSVSSVLLDKSSSGDITADAPNHVASCSGHESFTVDFDLEECSRMPGTDITNSADIIDQIYAIARNNELNAEEVSCQLIKIYSSARTNGLFATEYHYHALASALMGTGDFPSLLQVVDDMIARGYVPRGEMIGKVCKYLDKIGNVEEQVRYFRMFGNTLKIPHVWLRKWAIGHTKRHDYSALTELIQAAHDRSCLLDPLSYDMATRWLIDNGENATARDLLQRKLMLGGHYTDFTLLAAIAAHWYLGDVQLAIDLANAAGKSSNVPAMHPLMIDWFVHKLAKDPHFTGALPVRVLDIAAASGIIIIRGTYVAYSRLLATRDDIDGLHHLLELIEYGPTGHKIELSTRSMLKVMGEFSHICKQRGNVALCRDVVDNMHKIAVVSGVCASDAWDLEALEHFIEGCRVSKNRAGLEYVLKLMADDSVRTRPLLLTRVMLAYKTLPDVTEKDVSTVLRVSQANGIGDNAYFHAAVLKILPRVTKSNDAVLNVLAQGSINIHSSAVLIAMHLDRDDVDCAWSIVESVAEDAKTHGTAVPAELLYSIVGYYYKRKNLNDTFAVWQTIQTKYNLVPNDVCSTAVLKLSLEKRDLEMSATILLYMMFQGQSPVLWQQRSFINSFESANANGGAVPEIVAWVALLVCDWMKKHRNVFPTKDVYVALMRTLAAVQPPELIREFYQSSGSPDGWCYVCASMLAPPRTLSNIKIAEAFVRSMTNNGTDHGAKAIMILQAGRIDGPNRIGTPGQICAVLVKVYASQNNVSGVRKSLDAFRYVNKEPIGEGVFHVMANAILRLPNARHRRLCLRNLWHIAGRSPGLQEAMDSVWASHDALTLRSAQIYTAGSPDSAPIASGSSTSVSPPAIQPITQPPPPRIEFTQPYTTPSLPPSTCASDTNFDRPAAAVVASTATTSMTY